jgi:hypothetical protein
MMEDWQLLKLRMTGTVLALMGSLVCPVTGQSSADSRFSIVNLVHTDREIRFELQNNSNSAITFMQLRLEAACPDGTAVPVGGWGADALWTIAAGEDGELFAPVRIEPTLAGGLRPMEYPRSSVVNSQAGACEASRFKDFTVIFEDGVGGGHPELIALQLAKRRLQAETIRKWAGELHALLNADDPTTALKALRARLDVDYDDSQMNQLTEEESERLIMSREIRQVVDRQFISIRRLNESVETARRRVERMVGFFDRLESLLREQSRPIGAPRAAA